MRKLRKVVFWIHLFVGLCVGVVVFIMSVTGVLLMYEKQLTRWSVIQEYGSKSSASAPRSSIEDLLESAAEESSADITGVTIHSNPAAPVEVSFGRETTLYLDPVTAKVVADEPPQIRKFFRLVTEIHRYLGAKGEHQDMGKAITGACNLGFLFLVVSGVFLWWPRKWNGTSLRSVGFFRRGLSGRARNFNWHNVIGVWSALPLFIIVTSATVISYPWSTKLVYAAFGETPPARGPAPSSKPSSEKKGKDASATDEIKEPRKEKPASLGSNSAFEGLQKRFQAAAALADKVTSPTRDGMATPGRSVKLQPLFEVASNHVESWQRISFSPPSTPEKPVEFSIDWGMGGEPHKRGKLIVDAESGEVKKWETYADGTPGLRARSFMRFAHTGEVGGVAGQTIAGIVSAGAALLVWTGFSLTWRRWRTWRTR